MTIYVQYDASTADANQHVHFSWISGSAAAPQPPSNITQITFPDGTDVNNKMLDLSQNPPVLINIPAVLPPTVTITSTSTPSLNGTYTVDATALANLNGVTTRIMLNGSFPGNASSYPWYDSSGVAHNFASTTEFGAFATAICDYISALTLWQYGGSQGAAPSNALTIP